MNLANALTTILTRYNALESKFIVAVSGGKDSMSLLHACKNNGLNIVAVHCNFMLRGDESNADEIFVSQYCKDQGIPLEKIRFDTKTESKKRKLATQETARILRYEWFEKVRLQHDAEYILTAHHGNDSIETFIINLLRGTGIKGLTGIPEKNGFILRPLLGILRSEIDVYSSLYDIPFRNDSSNESDTYTRNYIRHNIIPLFEDVNKKALQHVLDAALLLNESNELTNDLLSKLTPEYTSQKGDIFSIHLDAIDHLTYKRTALFFWLGPYGFNSTVIDDILLTRNTGKWWQSDTHRVIYERGKLNLVAIDPFIIKEQNHHYPLPPVINFGKDAYVIETLTEKPEKFSMDTFYIDAALMEYPVRLRSWNQGDSFTPLGMKNKKKLSDFFTDLKLDAFQKGQAMVLESNNEIVAVLPHRINEKFKVTDKTSHIITLTLKEQA
ncbi:MAG: tRNA lysidine(34) synthetase TilS [Bacteroidota bacterium]